LEDNMDLNEEHLRHLTNIVEGGLLRKITPPEIAQELIKNGYARNAVGGLMPTEHGYKTLMNNKK